MQYNEPFQTIRKPSERLRDFIFIAGKCMKAKPNLIWHLPVQSDLLTLFSVYWKWILSNTVHFHNSSFIKDVLSFKYVKNVRDKYSIVYFILYILKSFLISNVCHWKKIEITITWINAGFSQNISAISLICQGKLIWFVLRICLYKIIF